MKLLKSEKIILIITALFLAAVLGFSLGKGEADVRVEFTDSAFQGRGGEQSLPAEESGEEGGEGLRVININTASQNELESLKGIGPVLAQRIIDYREAAGGFKTIEDITKVQGIGVSVYEDIWRYISVD